MSDARPAAGDDGDSAVEDGKTHAGTPGSARTGRMVASGSMRERELGLQGKVVVVAGGGGGGIGTAICRRLIEAGASVAALDIDAGKLALAEEAMKEASAGGPRPTPRSLPTSATSRPSTTPSPRRPAGSVRCTVWSTWPAA